MIICAHNRNNNINKNNNKNKNKMCVNGDFVCKKRELLIHNVRFTIVSVRYKKTVNFCMELCLDH